MEFGSSTRFTRGNEIKVCILCKPMNERKTLVYVLSFLMKSDVSKITKKRKKKSLCYHTYKPFTALMRIS